MNNQFDKIDQYLQGSLSEEELLAFEEELTVNQDLAEEVKLQKLTNEVTIESKLIDVRSKLGAMYLAGGTAALYSTFLKSVGVIGVSAVLSTFIVMHYTNLDEDQKTVKIEIPEVKETQFIEVINHVEEEVVTELDIIHQEEELVIITDSHVAISSTVIEEAEVPEDILFEEKKNKEHLQPIKTKSTVVKKEEQATDLVHEMPVTETIKTYAIPHHNSISEVEEIIHEQEDRHNPCASLRVATHIDVTPTCITQDAGCVKVDLVKTNGAKKPFFFSLDGVHYTMRNEFRHLKTGHYSLYIEDGQGCLIKASDMIHVKSKHCD